MKLNRYVLLGALICAGSLAAAPICPTTSNNDIGADSTGCGVLITMGASSSTVSVTGTGPYDGSDDTTVGVINNSSSALSSLTLTASNFAFGFDLDGIQAYTSTNGVVIGTGGITGYEGINNTFDITGISGGNGTLIVNFTTPIAVGGSDYFSLEGAPSVGSGIGVGGSAPEPASIAMLGTGMVGLAGLIMRRRRKQ